MVKHFVNAGVEAAFVVVWTNLDQAENIPPPGACSTRGYLPSTCLPSAYHVRRTLSGICGSLVEWLQLSDPLIQTEARRGMGIWLVGFLSAIIAGQRMHSERGDSILSRPLRHIFLH